MVHPVKCYFMSSGSAAAASAAATVTALSVSPLVMTSNAQKGQKET